MFHVIMTPSLTHVIWSILSQNRILFVNCNTSVVYFWGWGRVQKLFWDLLIQTYDFCFLSFALFLLYHVVVVGLWQYISENDTTSTRSVLLMLCLTRCFSRVWSTESEKIDGEHSELLKLKSVPYLIWLGFSPLIF